MKQILLLSLLALSCIVPSTLHCDETAETQPHPTIELTFYKLMNTESGKQFITCRVHSAGFPPQKFYRIFLKYGDALAYNDRTLISNKDGVLYLVDLDQFPLPPELYFIPVSTDVTALPDVYVESLDQSLIVKGTYKLPSNF